MDIPLWAWALGLLALTGIFEYFTDSKAQPNASKDKKIAPPQSPTSTIVNTNTHNTTSNNSWDGEIEGKTVELGSKWDLLRKKVLSRDNYKCTNCGKTSNLTVDHKVPLSLGGVNSMSNLTTLCKDCHEHKDQRDIFDKAFDAKDNYGEDHKLKRKVEILTKAINSGSRVGIAYTDYSGKRTTRSISPRRLAKDKGRIYCIAYCHLRDDRRTFRLSRIEI